MKLFGNAKQFLILCQSENAVYLQNMIIIAEAGATKTAWSAIGAGGQVRRVKGPGINVSTMEADHVKSIITEALDSLNPDAEEVDEVHFYGAGVLSDEVASLFPSGNVECASDMLAAARAVCGSKPGIAAILGTGSNSCLYDGSRIVKNVRSGGFILGDEGGGASLGRMFLSDFIKGLVPEPVASGFSADFQSDYMTIVANVYKSAAPSAYLGSFAQWLLDKAAADEYVRGLVKANFDAFFTRALMQYDLDRYEVGIVGGFAAAAGNMLHEAAEARGIRISTVCRDISDSLLAFHSGE